MAKREAPTVIVSSAALAMPTKAEREKMKKKRGGNVQYYDLSTLAVGKSLAIIGRTAKNLSTTISQNNKEEWPVLNADGKPVMIQKTDPAGNKVSVPKTEKRTFFAIDCDPATDPDKATARIWREA